MKRLAMLALALCLMGCSTIDLNCPCGGGVGMASSGGPTALLNALLPLLASVSKGGVPLFAAAGTAPAQPQMCATIHSTTFDLLGTTNITCSSLAK